MRKTCLVCGRGFDAPPSGAKTCSKPCASILKSRSHTGVPHGSWRQDRQAVERNLGRLREKAKANRRLIMADPASQRGPLNRAASDWVLRDPDGRIWRVHDLRDWARSHAHLFGLEDGERGAILVSSGMAAVKRSMEGKRDRVCSYKGWTLVSWSPSGRQLPSAWSHS